MPEVSRVRFRADRRRIRIVVLILVVYGAFFWWWFRDDPSRWMLVPIISTVVVVACLVLLDLWVGFRPILEVGEERVRWRSPWVGGWRQVRYEDVDAVDWRVDTVGLRVAPDEIEWMPFGSLRKRDRVLARELLEERLPD